MNKQYLGKLKYLVLTLTVLAVITSPSFGATVNLVAEESVVTMPDGVVVPMWGFFTDTGQACNTNLVWTVGPQIVVPPGDTTLQINLRNCLDTEGTSVVITGQGLPADSLGNILPPETFTDSGGRIRVTSFTTETAANGGTGSYTWNNLKAGTYLYQSGTHPALQVQMGLYGAMVADSAAGEAYPGINYDQDVILLYSEIDPILHDPPVTARPLNYKPKYFLVNGQPYQGGPGVPAGTLQQTTLLRFLNSGLKDHTPMITTGYFNVIAEDGNPYPYSHQQYTMGLSAGKTMDALFTPTVGGIYTVYDRSLHLTTNGMTNGGLITPLSVVDSGGLPVAIVGDDQTGVAVGVAISLDGSTSYDPDTAPNTDLTYLWSIESAPSGSIAAISDLTVVNPTFIPDVAGGYSFQLIVNDGLSDSFPDYITVTTNLTPLADAGMNVSVAVGALVQLDGSGSSDPDVYPNTNLTYLWTLMTPVGSSAVLSDPTIVNPEFTADVEGAYVAELIVDDGMASSSLASVTVTAGIIQNTAPVATDDGASTTRGTPVTIDLLVNDVDPDGSLNPSSVIITNNPTRGGSVVNHNNGTVTYTPHRGFRGTDIFTYIVSDDVGAQSNEATVRVNVTK